MSIVGGLKIGSTQYGNISTDAYGAQALDITPTAISGFKPIACVSYSLAHYAAVTMKALRFDGITARFQLISTSPNYTEANGIAVRFLYARTELVE